MRVISQLPVTKKTKKKASDLHDIKQYNNY